MLTGYPLSCALGRSVFGIGSGAARFLMIAEYATYRYLRCVVNVKIYFRSCYIKTKVPKKNWQKILPQDDMGSCVIP